MKFRKIKIIQFIQSAWRRLRLRFLCIAQQQAKEGYRRLQTTVEELQETIVLLQKRIEALESQLNKTNKRLADYQANAAANEKIEALGKKFIAELEKLDDKRIGDNKRIEDRLEKLKKMIKDLQEQIDEPGEDEGKRKPGKPNRTAEDGKRPPKQRPPRCRFVCYYEETDGRLAIALRSGTRCAISATGRRDLSANGGRLHLEGHWRRSDG